MNKKLFISSIIIMLVLAAGCVVAAMAFSQGAVMNEVITEMDNASKAEEMIADMTIEEKVGQMFMGCFYSYTPSWETVNNYHLGGVLLFKPSFVNSSKEYLTSKLAVMDGVCDIAPITGVDEEGGDVVRVSASTNFRSEPFKSPRTLYAEGGMDAVIADTHEKNNLLKSIGIDMNLAPVCDISTDPSDFMYSRSIGLDPQMTADFAAKSVEACKEDNMGCSLKHFPGYGAAVDTHIGSAVDNRTLEQLQGNDIVPFKAAIDAGAHSILISHNTVTAIDSTMPASLSPAVHKILREDLGFDGVIITDDLIMGAVTEYGTESEIAVAAILAGNDILCSGDFYTQYYAVLDAVNNGVITEERINESVKRILMLKLQLGVIS